MVSLRTIVAVLAVLAVPSIASPAVLERTAPTSSCVVASEPPLVTEVAQFLVTSSTAINEPGVYTLTNNHSVEVVTVATTTTYPLTTITTRTTIYICSTSTTYTSCPISSNCETPTTFCWSPPTHKTKPTSCPTQSAMTVTATVTDTVTATVTDTVTNNITLTVSDSCAITSSRVPSTTSHARNSTSTTKQVQPTLSCDKYGYLIQASALYRVDVGTGNSTLVKKNVGASVNAIGYNSLDNYIYGWTGGENSIVRLSASGSLEYVYKLKEKISAPVGDVDNEGYYWYGTGGATNWYKHDLRPGSRTYGQLVASGTTPDSKRSIHDWVHIPIAGNYLWALGNDSPNGGTDLMYWSMATHRWTVKKNYPNIKGVEFGALYAVNTGVIYASDNVSGDIYSFDISGLSAPRLVSHGPSSSSNDGARCVMNLDVS